LHELHWSDADGFMRELPDRVREREMVRYETVLRPRTGRPIDTELVCNAYRDGKESPNEVIQINMRDVSERKQADRALSESEERFRLLVEGVKDYAIFMLDTEGRVVSWNLAAERILGYNEAELLGQGLRQIFTPEDRGAQAPEKELWKAASAGKAEAEGWRVRKDG